MNAAAKGPMRARRGSGGIPSAALEVRQRGSAPMEGQGAMGFAV